jgi:hypothetical protein
VDRDLEEFLTIDQSPAQESVILDKFLFLCMLTYDFEVLLERPLGIFLVSLLGHLPLQLALPSFLLPASDHPAKHSLLNLGPRVIA